MVDIRGSLGSMGNLPCYMGVFDEVGNKIFEPSEQMDYDIYSVTVLSHTEFEVMFMGKDDLYYTAKVNANGKFLTEPQPA